MIKPTINKNTMRKYLLMIACLLLFIAGGYRAFTLYNTYRSYESEVKSITESSDRNMHKIIELIIKEEHDVDVRTAI